MNMQTILFDEEKPMSAFSKNAPAAKLELDAERGDPEAQLELGLMYLHGRGVRVNYAMARAWLEKAAEQDEPDAQHELGLMYYYGRGVAVDRAEAYKWFKLAAEQPGNYAAQMYLQKLSN
jgi:Tfp pilus assembly protein PilF